MGTVGHVGSPLGATRPLISQKPGLSPSDVHVLLVDDEPLSRTIISNLLRRCEYTGAPCELVA